MDAVYNCYMMPKKFTSYNSEDPDFQMDGLTSPVEDVFYTTKPQLLDGYTPKNNKLKVFPFVHLEVNNNNGVSNIMKYELFSGNLCNFKIKGVPSVGGSIKLIPQDYKGTGTESGLLNEEEGIIAGKFPCLNWSENNYLMWLSQQAVNLSQGLQSAGLQVVGGTVATLLGLPEVGGALIGEGFGNAGRSAIDYVKQKQIAEMQPNTSRGNTNAGDINVCSSKNGFFFYQKSIRREYAKVIDDYFTRLGYQINETKVPNLTGRPIFNYVQIAKSESIGYGSVPSKFMEIINNAFRNGVTIWHNHENIGNYNLNNQLQ